MYRNELDYSDEQLIILIQKNYGIKPIRLRFLNAGSFFGFIVESEGNPFFLKVYPKQRSFIPGTFESITAKSLNYIGLALHHFQRGFGTTYLANCIQNNVGQFCVESNEVLLMLFEYIEGFHPSYLPNQLMAHKLAKLLFQLHKIPTKEFPQFAKEDFNIQYAVEFGKYINQSATCEKVFFKELLGLINKNKLILREKLNNLKIYKKNFLKKHPYHS